MVAFVMIPLTPYNFPVATAVPFVILNPAFAEV